MTPSRRPTPEDFSRAALAFQRFGWEAREAAIRLAETMQITAARVERLRSRP